MYTLIVTAKMNDIDPQAWLADVLADLRPLAGRLSAMKPTPVSAAVRRKIQQESRKLRTEVDWTASRSSFASS